MKRGFLLIVLISLLIVLGAYGCKVSENVEKAEKGEPAETQAQTRASIEQEISEEAEKAETATIEITSAGFKPNKIIINAGTKVTFINKDSKPHWPASDVHPIHTLYPGSSIGKCGTEEQSEIFDACKGLQQNEEWSFIFNEKGSWSYHDHLNPSFMGIIEVV